MPTTVTISIGSRTTDSITVSTVTTTTVTGFSNAWSVVLSASVPSTTKIGDKLTTGANSYLITGISGSTLTVVGDAGAAFTSTTTPAAGSATTTRSFATVNAWTSGSPANLVTKDWIWKGELYKEGGGTNGEWTISSNNATSVTCDSTRYILLTAAPGQSFTDNANKLTNALRYNAANGTAISMSGNYVKIFDTSGSAVVKISGLQIRRTGASSGYLIGNNAEFSQCIIWVITYISTTSVNIYNSLIFYASSADGLFNQGNPTLVNNTIYNSVGGANALLYGNYTATGTLLRNNTFFGFNSIANRFDKINTANSTYNITNLASFGWTATGNLVSKVAANQFTSLTGGSEDFRIKAGADVINAGVRAQTYTNDVDIVGSARSITTPTIGAWEYPSTTYTYSRPSSDITAQWTSSTAGAPNYTMIDETTFDDNDYINSTAAAQTSEVGIQPMAAPVAGTNVSINYRVQGVSGGSTVTVSLYCGGTLIKTDTTRNANNTTPDYYTMTVTPAEWASVTDWSNMRIRFVSG